MSTSTGPPVPDPGRRRLRTYAFDPMSSRLDGRLLTVGVPWEHLVPGPLGRLVAVVDYDPARNIWYAPVDLNDGAILAQDGLRPTESDPRSHQQVVYAVASSVLERIERFIGRRFRWRRDGILCLVPHAFTGSNAYFDPRRGVLFGYYSADKDSPGRNLPGQTIFTCLSNDIVAHEVTHAVVHRLRPLYLEPTNGDMLALHEGIADLVALFQHFAYPDIVNDAITRSSADIDNGTGLFDLAHEFGESTGRGTALRSALDAQTDDDPAALEASIAAYAASSDPHERAANLVIGVFDAFLEAYRAAIADLLRISTGGTGTLPPGRLHPDLVNRVTNEAIKTADRLLGMVLRAFDYMPVVDATFGDLVRSIVTADCDLYPDDERRLRTTLVEALRRRRIYPDAASLADDSLKWPAPPGGVTPLPRSLLASILASGTKDMDLSVAAGTVKATYGDPSVSEVVEPVISPDTVEGDDGPTLTGEDGQPADPGAPTAVGGGRDSGVRRRLESWCAENAGLFGLDPDYGDSIRLRGVHVSYRVASDGQPSPEIVLQFSQNRPDLAIRFSGVDIESPDQVLHVRAGTLLILRADGTVKYVNAKPLPSDVDSPDQPGARRLANIHEWVETANAVADETMLSNGRPAVLTMTLARLHQQAL